MLERARFFALPAVGFIAAAGTPALHCPVKYASRILFGCVAALLVLGMVMLFSASTGHKQTNYLLMQPIWCAVGLLACWLAATIDYRWLKAYPWVPWAILLFASSLLVLVLVPGIKVTINGASRWLKAGPFTMQPSEIMELSIVAPLILVDGRKRGRVKVGAE